MKRTVLVMGLVATLWFGLVMAFPYTRTVYTCEGEMEISQRRATETVFVAVDVANWWLFWGDDGQVFLEREGGKQHFFAGLERLSNRYFFYGNSSDNGVPDGIFSALSKSLQFRIRTDEFFEGECRK